ncbi:hypothetical protein BKA67DRAFT_572656 [Truncatella angustata]|uniref:Uncharacterized protein n=1 Tax=Truncatella angustata TaxID=152316 RepID=A0A9P8UHA4_9PEZI|nr:uncharacterized protein BKA67DRAFT_572656 [Truncatella angustata]KAH6652002.1 hypothetical protein BKA67DRAFT_572656 [Truncatella angustata]
MLDTPPHITDLVRDKTGIFHAEAPVLGLFGNAVGDSIFVNILTSYQNVGRCWYPELLPLALKIHQALSE